MPYKKPLKKRLSNWSYRLRARLCRDIISEEMAECLHPEFGWIWREEEDGGRYIRQAFEDGQNDVLERIARTQYAAVRGDENWHKVEKWCQQTWVDAARDEIYGAQ